MQQVTNDAVDVVYAGFWRRWAALFLDQLILSAAFYAVVIALAILAGIAGGFGWFGSLDPDTPSTAVIVAYLAFIGAYYAAAALYYSLMESSRHQATLGKMALGIKVVDNQGGRLSFGHALGRWFAAALSYLTLYIGFLMAGFTERKRALHDMAAGTLVVDRWAWTAHPELQKQELGGCLVAIMVAGILMVLLFVASILAAIAIPAYQDYLQRAKVAQATVDTAPLRRLVADFRASSGSCPFNGEGGIAAEDSPGIVHASRLTVGEFDDGSCGVELELGNTGHTALDGGRIWWQLGADDAWSCSSSLDDRWLAEECRG